MAHVQHVIRKKTFTPQEVPDYTKNAYAVYVLYIIYNINMII